jgi:hypothetical protein
MLLINIRQAEYYQKIKRGGIKFEKYMTYPLLYTEQTNKILFVITRTRKELLTIEILIKCVGAINY